MIFKIQTSLLLLLTAFYSFAQKDALQSIQETDLKAHLEYIASDLMMGRDFNTDIPGLDLTADYLKAQCKKMGVKPGGEDFFQRVPLVNVRPDSQKSQILVQSNDGSILYRDKDFFAFGIEDDGDELSGELVFAGYGWTNEDSSYDDLKDLDLENKIVLIMTRTPETTQGMTKNGMEEATFVSKVRKVAERGAKALIFIPDPMGPDLKMLNMIKEFAIEGHFELADVEPQPRAPVMLVFGTEQLADILLEETGKSLAHWQNEINQSKSPRSFPIEKVTVSISLPKSTHELEGKNIIGIIEGSDPVLKNECIVFSAHYDHVGVSTTGEVYNGADDNGTGTVALLEIAEAFQHLKKKPKRSLVFAWVTAEEKGLVGSDYYSQHPYFPLEKTLLNINLDMVGRSAEKEPSGDFNLEESLAGPDGIYIVSGEQSSELTKISEKVCTDLGLISSDKLTEEILHRSDYYHFYKNGIPILGLTTGLHDDYHQASDDTDRIDYTKMKRVTQYAFLVAHKVANQKKRIVVDKPVEVE